MPIAVVNGCNSGIGHAFAHILIEEVGSSPKRERGVTTARYLQGHEVYATDYITGVELRSLPCYEAALDVRSEGSIQAVASELAAKPVDLLLNVAGTLIPHKKDTLETVFEDGLTKLF